METLAALIAEGGNYLAFVAGVVMMLWRHDKRISALEIWREYENRKIGGSNEKTRSQ